MTTRTSIPASTSNYHPGRISPVIRYIVIHDGETQELPTAAEGMGYWFQNPGAGGSAHKGTDSDSICTYINDADTAWGAPYVNADGLHVEQGGRASQAAADWSDPYSKATIANTAIVLAEWYPIHHIPLRPMSDAQLAARNYAGVITHAQATRTLGPAGGHTDPGAYYPLGTLLAQANALLGHVAPAPVVLPPVTKKPSGKIWLKVDGVIGRATRARMQQWLHESIDGIWGTNTIAGMQRWLRVRADGVLGPVTWKALQRAIGAKPDGIPGPLTGIALQRFLNAR